MTLSTEEQYPFPASELQRLKKRGWILNYLPKDCIGMEIGVFRGHFSEVIAQTASPKTLYLVDPWTRLGETFGWGQAYTNFDSLPTRIAKDEVVARMAKFDSIETIIIEDFSQDFLPNFTGTVDWVYLDSSHGFQNTYRELCLLDRVLAKNGIIAGDDWHPGIHNKHHGVFRAVNEFIKSHDYQFVAAGLAGQWCLRRSPDYQEEAISLRRTP